MIILLISLFTITTFAGFMFIKNKAASRIIGSLSLILLCLSIGGLTAHIINGWGMEDITTTSEKEIYTAGDPKAPYGMIIYQQIGTESNDYVFVYRDNKKDKEAKDHFAPDMNHVTEAIKQDATYKLTNDTKAKVVSEVTHREFKSKSMEVLFGIGKEAGELVSEHDIVYIPKKTWLMLTPDQAKELQAKGPEMAKQAQQAMMANPAQAQAMQELAKSDPQSYAEMQVQQIKDFLNIK